MSGSGISGSGLNKYTYIIKGVAEVYRTTGKAKMYIRL